MKWITTNKFLGITSARMSIENQTCGEPPFLPSTFTQIKKDFTLKWLEDIGKKDLRDCFPESKPNQTKKCTIL